MNKSDDALDIGFELAGRSPALVRAASQTLDECSSRKTRANLHGSVAMNHLKTAARWADAGNIKLAIWNFAEAAREAAEAERIMRGCVE